MIGEIMFSHKHDIPAEHPLHYEWKHNIAIPTLKEMGYDVHIVKGKEDYLSIFNKRYKRSENPNKIGKKWGFMIASTCSLKRYCKILAMDSWCKKQGDFHKILGYAYDEKKRIESMLKTPNVSSTLYDLKIKERETFDICRPYNLLSPIYDTKNRDGCWFCPNQSVEQMARFAKEYPQYWALLEELAKDPDLASQNFRFGETFAQVNQQIKIINSQISIFEIM